MKINTYAVNCNDAWLNTEGDDISGSYVKYKDHQDVVAELEAKCAALAAELKQSQIDAGCYKKGMEESNARLVQVASENAGLNEKMDKLATWPGIEFYSSAWEFNNGDGNDALEFMCDVQTPATESFLAEVRASAVEGAVGTIMVHINHQHVAVAEALHILRTHATQLRQEAAQ